MGLPPPLPCLVPPHQPSPGPRLPVPGRSWPACPPGMCLRMAGEDGDGVGWPWGRQGPMPPTPQQSLSHSPVLMTFWMALATWPLSRELRSLTRRMRQVQSTTRDPASSTSPTARSGSGVLVKRCSPAPQHGWARGWGRPSPTHKPAPLPNSPTSGPQPNISQPCPTS
uniref:Uncharacterized protein n=1 Tax=Strix occidentalis caurina TaxID=311401 RepID=A0A8D0KTQ4_STROC